MIDWSDLYVFVGYTTSFVRDGNSMVGDNIGLAGLAAMSVFHLLRSFPDRDYFAEPKREYEHGTFGHILYGSLDNS